MARESELEKLKVFAFVCRIYASLSSSLRRIKMALNSKFLCRSDSKVLGVQKPNPIYDNLMSLDFALV